MSIEDFKTLDLLKIKLHIDNNKYNSQEYLEFCISCVFVIHELNKIKEFKECTRAFYTDFIRNIETNNELKSYNQVGYRKILTCKLVNCYGNILNKIPTKLLDIIIITVPVYNKNVKMPFELGTIKLDNNILSIVHKNAPNSDGLFSFFYNLLSNTCEKYHITYSGHVDDIQTIEFDNDSIIYTVIENNKNILNYETVKKEILIPKFDFNYIIYRKKYA
jgi:hypothetical protein